MATRLTPIAFDIETTGFEIDDRVTTLGVALPLGCRAFVTADGRVDLDTLEAALQSRFETPITLSSHETERELLSAVAAFAAESLSPRDYLLVAYNGERYRGGFDLPFLRTRCARTDVGWPFGGVPYADLYPIVRDRFNTTCGGNGQNGLEGAYEALVGGSLTAADPFEDSSEAVDAFEAGAYRPLLEHNVADVLRTAALAAVAQRYCGTADFSMKRLTPTLEDPRLDSGGN